MPSRISSKLSLFELLLMFENVLFVCIGNVCRSPYAEAALRHHFEQKNLPFQTSSVGLGALVGESADPFSINLAKQKNYDLSQHIAQQIHQEAVLNAKLIIAMEQEHLKQIQKSYPFSIGKVHLLGKWQNNEEVMDPYKKPKNAFETMAIKIDSQLNDWIIKFYS
ncbi:low molecular weight phosphotyrosine protein phosphatase [Francisellaceae bacterium]|nr:low molecular weight phosphotyrosine protein phosphatase [Francisellaceae bacterium]